VLAETYLARTGQWRLPELLGIIETPIMRPDGTILNSPGYDETTGLYLCGTKCWPAIPDSPTREDAKAGALTLLEPFCEFPFVDQASRSAFLAGVLTSIQRRLLDSAPLFAFDAPAQRSGKSLLAESIGLLATGRRPAATGAGSNPEEMRKLITSALRENQPIVGLDNITFLLNSSHLAIALTQYLYEDRLLGANRMLRLRTNVTWTATGNNLTFGADLTSRVLVTRIDAGVERPEERTFKFADLPAYLLANRKHFVVAALTILRAYHAAGRPRQQVPIWGVFEQWSREIREPIVWLGLADPYTTRTRVIASDPDLKIGVRVFAAWYLYYPDEGAPVADVIRARANDPAYDELGLAIQ
jgi:hypothetical protein